MSGNREEGKDLNALRFPQPLAGAVFLRRTSRFSAVVRSLDATFAASQDPGDEQYVYLPNSGRLGELLVPGARVYIAPVKSSGSRRTTGDLVLVEAAGGLVSVDSRLPQLLLEKALEKGVAPGFEGWRLVRREPTYHDGRLDLLLGRESDALEHTRSRTCLVEAKSVTLVVDGEARFPDAPTERGRRHLDLLGRAVQEGYRAVIVFVVQRSDARRFTPNRATDPRFADALTKASRRGVEVLAFGCRVNLQGIRLYSELPVALEEPLRSDSVTDNL